MNTADELLSNGYKREVWTKYCGFLDLDLPEFMRIQERLLMEQVALIARSPLSHLFLGGKTPLSVDEFRQSTPITTYEDYAPYLLKQRDDSLPQKAFLWAHTSGRSGQAKWVPYTEKAYQRLGERVLSGVILATARGRGDIQIEPGDTLVYNTPPRPYVSGVALRALGEQFHFNFIPPLDETEAMSFQERIEKGFETGLVTGIDILGSMSVILVKMGEGFAEGANTLKFSRKLLHPAALLRVARGLVRSRMERRKLLPKDLWHIKGLPCGGTDTAIYRDKIAYYWGVLPYEQYGSTEEGAVATQAWNKKGMTFFPDAAFYEFIPETELAILQKNPAYTPRTVLLDEVRPGERYELVLTNFYGKPLVRYRMHDLITFSALEDKETGIRLPQMVFVGRSDDFIDLAGFTGLIDEKMVWQALVNTGVRFTEWTIRKEHADDHPYLHLYIELNDPLDARTVRDQVDQEMKALNHFYRDYTAMIGAQELMVTLLSKGTFQAYVREKQAAGVDPAHFKPAHMNAPDPIIADLLRISRQNS